MSVSPYVDQIREQLTTDGMDDHDIRHYCANAEGTLRRVIAQIEWELKGDFDAIEEKTQKQVSVYMQSTQEGYEIVAIPAKISLPEQSMLPHLLKNAKVAKDGSLYKVIPIGKKKSTILEDYRRGFRSDDTPKQQEFRTASSKQSASRKWVTPKRDVDVSEDIRILNIHLSEQIDNAIGEILSDIRQRMY